MTRRSLVTSFLALLGGMMVFVDGPARADNGRGDLPAGELRCEVRGGFELLASANRNLDCRYTRLDRRIELYTGYTGITGANVGTVVPRTLVYQVFSSTPRALVPLAGDFKGSLGGSSSANELAGGSDGNVRLRETSAQTTDIGSTTLTAPINAVAGFGYLHLIYAGVVPGGRRATGRVH